MQVTTFTHLFNDNHTLQIGTDTVTGQHRVIVMFRNENNRISVQRFNNKNLDIAVNHFNTLKTQYNLA